MPAPEPLQTFQPRHPFFVGIDSDGCVFDSMELKQKECFIPNIVRVWGLQGISKYARETAEFVNLYSRQRGVNRWIALVQVFDLLAERPEVRARQVALPDDAPLRDWLTSGRPLTDKTLEALIAENPHPTLLTAREWSRAVNESVTATVANLPPFPYVRESLERLRAEADLMVVSQTPAAALEREWAEHDLTRFVCLIGGQELGTKGEILQHAAQGRYPSSKILMIGDAPGDLKAARSAGALFFPINPGDEEHSWKRFYEEGIDAFLGGRFEGEYEAGLLADFNRRLPESPPWKTA